MSEESPRVWVALDPEGGQVLLLLNGHPVGTVVKEGGIRFRIAPQFAELGPLDTYAMQLFAHMNATLLTALFEVTALRITAAGRAAAATIPADQRRWLHLGCGPDLRPSWLNIDFKDSKPAGYDAATGYLNFDLRAALPLPNASVDLIFSSHFFEHLLRHDAVALMAECRRVLKPGGVIRFQMPDYETAFAGYVGKDQAMLQKGIDDGLLDHFPPYARHWGDLISRAVYEFEEHKYVWDPENMSVALRAVGFSEVVQDGFQENVDVASRDAESFYLQATA